MRTKGGTRHYGWVIFSLSLTNLTGHPAVSLKAGFINGTPVQIMVTGRLYDEGTMLRVALAYERATTWHTMHPKV